jgi:hypothetical protein
LVVSAPEPILDNVALRVMAFAHSDGIALLLAALNAPRARFPTEVYNRDEDALTLDADDTELSELARGLRYARRQVASLSPTGAQRYLRWLQHAAQIPRHLDQATLVIDPLTVSELPLREHYRTYYGIGRGEAACLVLSRRHGAAVVFLSSDEVACQAAVDLGMPYLTLQDVLTAWVDQLQPTVAQVDVLVTGMRAAKFGLAQEVIDELRRRAKP